MSLIHKDFTSVNVANTTTETQLGTFDFDRFATLSNELPLGSNKAVRLTFVGAMEYNAYPTVQNPAATFKLYFGQAGTFDQIVYIPTGSPSYKIVFDILLSDQDTVLWSQNYYVGDLISDPGDNRVGVEGGVLQKDLSVLKATLKVALSHAHTNLRVVLHGFYVEHM